MEELAALVTAVRESLGDLEQVMERAEQLRRLRASGAAYSDIVPHETRPLIVELLSGHLQRISDAGSRFRRAEARALHDEGMTMERIAELFGVTRQRVSALVRR
jgi:hypothetical protein